MPFNPGIADPSLVTQGVRESKIDLATPVNMYTSLRQDARAQRLSDLTLTKEETEQKRAAELQGIIKSSLTPDGHIDSEKAYVSLNRAGFYDEASHIEERMAKAQQERQSQQEAQAKDMSSAFLGVVDSKNPVQSFLLARDEGLKKGWKMSPGLLEYNPSDQEIASGKFANPKVGQELLYLGERFLTPEQRIARAKANGDKPSDTKFGLTPIYGKRGDQIVALQASDSGGVKEIQLPDGITLTPGVTFHDLGGQIGMFDKSGTAIGTINKGIDPGKKQDLALKGADLALKQADNARKEEEFKAKKLDLAKKAKSYEKENSEAIQSIQTFLDKAHSVKENPNMKYVTGAGGVVRLVPGTPAADLQADIDFLVSSGVIETLRNLKSQSPTGASGFGALSEKEMSVIQNAFSIIGNTKISPNKKREELGRVISIMEKRQRETRGLFRESNDILGPEPTEEEKLDNGIDGL